MDGGTDLMPAERADWLLFIYMNNHRGCSLNIIHLFLQVDNKGNHLLVHEESSINVPAIAAAHVIKRYIAQAADELSFEVTGLKMRID